LAFLDYNITAEQIKEFLSQCTIPTISNIYNRINLTTNALIICKLIRKTLNCTWQSSI